MAITTRHDRRNYRVGTFRVNDNYKSLILQVKIGDQFVMVMPMRSEAKLIQGLYRVSGEELSNPHITRHSKNSYSHIVKIEKVKVLDWPGLLLYAEVIYEVDLKKYDSYDSYFNHGTKSNSIKRLSDEQFLIFKNWIDLMEHWYETCEHEPFF